MELHHLYISHLEASSISGNKCILMEKLYQSSDYLHRDFVQRIVVLYCEWIGDPTNQHFRNLNHVDCPDYEPPTLRQIKKHFCECCDIPLHYDHESPSTAKIAGEASWRKRLWGHLEDVVSCSNPNCEFRPWAGSPLEKYFLVMFVDLMGTEKALIIV